MSEKQKTARYQQRRVYARRVLHPGTGSFARRVRAFADSAEAGFARACLAAGPAAPDYAVWADWREERGQPSAFWRYVGGGGPNLGGIKTWSDFREANFTLARAVGGGDLGRTLYENDTCVVYFRNPAGRLFRWQTRSRLASSLDAGDLVVFSAAWKGESAIEVVVHGGGRPGPQPGPQNVPSYEEIIVNVGRVQFMCLADAFAVLDGDAAAGPVGAAPAHRHDYFTPYRAAAFGWAGGTWGGQGVCSVCGTASATSMRRRGAARWAYCDPCRATALRRGS